MKTLEPETIKLSAMDKTWILDLDGTIVYHNGPYYLGVDKFLPGAKEFLDSIPNTDMIIFLTARCDYEKKDTLEFLKRNHVRYDHIIFNAGHAERILVNDMKPDGLIGAIAINTMRDRFCKTGFEIDKSLTTRYD